ncbi:outer membrane lipoprotein lolB domain-containing protein [Ditylenchus destructor]|nr:outer membrane lipoprotein lolB domain-containing protein [Ditylenchus destructor]
MSNGRTDEAEKRLAAARDAEPDYAIQLYLIQAETLSANNQSERAWKLLQQALRKKRNDLAQMEKDLRLIIKRDPDNAMALNALGYTLSDRTTRYAEAKVLIEQAHKLTGRPGRARQPGLGELPPGQPGRSRTPAAPGAGALPDQEVAAHLGEVLWANGKQREARQIWEKFLKEQPESPILRGTLKRLTGSETFKLMFLRHIIIFSFIACSPGNPAQWKQHKDKLSSIDGWQIEGKVGVRAPKDSGSGTLFWLQRQDYYDIRLSGPLGRGAARLTGRPGQVSLEVANQGRYEATSPEALLEEQIGWKLPVSHLVWWVRGLPAPDSKSRLSLNSDSRLATLEQDGWQVEYLSYVEQSGYWLPERIKLHGTDLDVTLVIKDWQPRKLGQ